VSDALERPLRWPAVVILPLAAYLLVWFLTALAVLRRAAAWETTFDAAARIPLDPFVLAAIQAVSFGGVLTLGLMWHRPRTGAFHALNVTPIGTRMILLAVTAGLALQFPLAEVGNLVQELFPIPIERQLYFQRMLTVDSPTRALGLVAALVVVAPLTEELLFRGLLLFGLADRYGPGFALGTTSLAFGLVHPSIVAFTYATLSALILGAIALRTRSVATSVALHAGVNAVPLLLPVSLVRIPGLNTVSEEVYHLPWWILGVTIPVCAFALFALTRLMNPTNERSEDM